MKKFFPVIIFLTLVCLVTAQKQGEQLTPISINAPLYYSSKNYQPNPHGNLRSLIAEGVYVVNTDTLQLPFVDDFSANQEPPYMWYENHITDSFFNVVGGCLVVEGLNPIQGVFSSKPTWQYYYDVAHFSVDSFAKNPVAFTYFSQSSSNCLNGSPQTLLLWPQYYYYDFDSSGIPMDSFEVINGALDTINYVPKLYFAQPSQGTLWFDNFAYINNTFPINPPTIGVATLDGFNQYGLPYNAADNTGGQADYLTSKPIDLSALSPSDSLYVSFFFEGGGLGDYPDIADSLVLEFKDISGNWNIVWYDSGYSDPTLVPDTFQQVLVPVLVPPQGPPFTYYYNTFQFRFRNVVTLYGGNNLWHIDYVRFDKNRSSVDSVIHDMAFTYPFPTILKNYTLEPASQYADSTDLTDSINLHVRNLDPNAFTNPPATDFVTQASELSPIPGVVAAPLLLTFNAGPYDSIQILPASQYKITTAANADTMVVNSEVFINPNDTRAQNDTLHHAQNFTDIMAYDDGSAETAYNLTGLGTKKFAYEFQLNKPDTLAAFQIMFTQIDANVQDLVFNFQFWDTLQLDDYTYVDSPIVNIINQLPFYLDSTNGYATYVLDTPIIISNKVYAGWAQDDERGLQVGFDLNSTLGRNHMYVYLNGKWDSSSVPALGSPMIRLIFNGSYKGHSSNAASVNNLAPGQNSLTLYPNPTTGDVYIRGSHYGAAYDVYLENTLGQQVQHQAAVTNQINISQLANDVYIFYARDLLTGEVFRQKIVKTAN